MKTENTINGADAGMQVILRTLDTQVEHYSVSTQMRLNDARARAIAATRAKVPFWRSHSILGAAFAFSAVVAFVLLTNVPSQRGSVDIEATALYEATFGAEQTFSEADIGSTALQETALNGTALDAAGLDETVLANDLEFYAWLSESTHAIRVPAGSGS